MYVKCSEDSDRMNRKSPFCTTLLSFDAPSPANPREYLCIIPSKVILGSTKVVDFGTNRKRVYDFLLVVYSNFCRITHLRNLMWNRPMTLKYAQGHWQSYHLKAVVWPCMQNVRKTVTEWTENRHFVRPHSHLTPPLQRTPANICINLILPETTFLGLHSCRWQYMGSSASFRTVLSESRRRQPISCRARNRF